MSRDANVKLPDLRYDFDHALITGADFGPRRDVTVTVQLLEWIGNRGSYGPERRIHVGGIVNFDGVQLFFTKQFKGKRPKGMRRSFDIAWLQYAKSPPSKPGHLFVEIVCERTDGKVVMQCSHIHVDE